MYVYSIWYTVHLFNSIYTISIYDCRVLYFSYEERTGRLPSRLNSKRPSPYGRQVMFDFDDLERAIEAKAQCCRGWGWLGWFSSQLMQQEQRFHQIGIVDFDRCCNIVQQRKLNAAIGEIVCLQAKPLVVPIDMSFFLKRAPQQGDSPCLAKLVYNWVMFFFTSLNLVSWV